MLAGRISVKSRRMAAESEFQLELTGGVSHGMRAFSCRLASDAYDEPRRGVFCCERGARMKQYMALESRLLFFRIYEQFETFRLEGWGSKGWEKKKAC